MHYYSYQVKESLAIKQINDKPEPGNIDVYM